MADGVPVDDPIRLRATLNSADALLLDFDGPICSVFAGLPAPVVAEQLRKILAEGGHKDLPPDVQKSDDPFDVLEFANGIGNGEARYIEAALRAHEVEAIKVAVPTSETHALIEEWHNSGRKLAIVSNNSAAAVEAYLHLHELARYVHEVAARTEIDTLLLKPNPFLVNKAVGALGVAATRCVLIGDSLTDIQAGHAAKVPVVGYANKFGKVAAMVALTPALVTTSMTIIRECI